MNRTPVQSSNIKSVGHENDILEVEFQNGQVYQYPNTPRSTYVQMLSGGSVGKMFHRTVRKRNVAGGKV